MADSLDDFFAKKDKSRKSKTRSKFTTAETIAKNLEESGKKPEIPRREMKEVRPQLPPTNNNTTAQITPEQEDEEWKFIEVNEERDYTGLKIQALTLSEKEKDDEPTKEQFLDENGDIVKTGDGPSGPWKVTSSLPLDSPEGDSKTIEAESQDSCKPKAYKPPAKRVIVRRNTKHAPEIGSELHFPTLSAAVKIPQNDNDKSFQSVKHGIPSKADDQDELQLELENKFAALPDED